ncbi:MAG: hypothetical protein F6K28_23500 [Microcoleus sp. SIO2G3]|nr:hypothetical protein [Microcoleus sp. SIO2G3]
MKLLCTFYGHLPAIQGKVVMSLSYCTRCRT